ncbi:MAG: hypothetical protein QM726_10835 [Chitinophagaceae bacterium]
MISHCYRVSIAAFCIPCLFALVFSACHSQQPSQVVIMSPGPIKETPAPIAVSENLTAAQLEKINRIQSVFAEVFPESIEETVADFKKDKNPDAEIGIWLSMANAYEKFTAKQKSISPEKKKEVFTLLLMRSMQEEAEAIASAKLTLVDDKEASEICSYYQAAAAPLLVK